MPTCGHDRSIAAGCRPASGRRSVFLLFQALLVGFLLFHQSPCNAAGEAARKETQEKPAATGIDPGFQVTIPEVSIGRIIGRKTPPDRSKQPEKARQQETAEPAGEFDEPPSSTQATHPEGQSGVRKPHSVDRLPFEPLPVKPLGGSQPTDRGKTGKVTIGVPMAPEDPMEARPPRKLVLRGRIVVRLPELTTVALHKGMPTPMRTEPDALEEMATSDWIPLQPREVLETLAGPEPPPQPEETPPTEPEFTEPPAEEPRAPTEATTPADTPLEPPQEPESSEPPLITPDQTTEPESQFPSEPEFSSGESTPPTGTAPVQPLDSEGGEVEELPPTEPEENIPSPLSDSAPATKEVRDYVQATMPILEELSLLMARVPSFGVEDFDPSDPNATVVPSDIAVRMDAMKRQLQILDSKTFAIIPPQDYIRFHSMIRESITETFRACEAMVNFFNDRNDEDLRRVKEHLEKARSLLKRTRKSSGGPVAGV